MFNRIFIKNKENKIIILCIMIKIPEQVRYCMNQFVIGIILGSITVLIITYKKYGIW